MPLILLLETGRQDKKVMVGISGGMYHGKRSKIPLRVSFTECQEGKDGGIVNYFQQFNTRRIWNHIEQWVAYF